MRGRITIIVTALVLGGLAAVFAASYLRSARVEIAEQNEPIEVLVAQEALPRGMTGTELVERKLVVSKKVPRQWVSADAISSTRGIENQVLAVAVGPGEQLTRTRFQYPAQAGLSYSVPDEYVAVACEVDEVSGVAGLVKPGDYVMVYATLSSDPSKRDVKTVVLIPRARVLAVGRSVGVETEPAQESESRGGVLSGQAQTRQQEPSTVTLALMPGDAGKLVFAQETGSIRLALLPAAGSKVAAPSPISFRAVFE